MSKKQPIQTTHPRFPESVQLAIDSAIEPIEFEVRNEMRALIDRINELITKAFKESGLTYDGYTNVEHPDPIALAVDELSEAVTKRVTEARIRRFFESFNNRILAEFTPRAAAVKAEH